MYSATSECDKLASAQPCRRFSLVEILSATNDFDDKLVIGHGGFGKVYKGHIFSEATTHEVAIKRCDFTSDQGAPEFRAEIEMLSRLRHCHLVTLIGYCDDSKEMILVYKYMHHGTLYRHLHKAKTCLTWMQRLMIALGAGRGLDYLHTGVGSLHGVIHRDMKSSNILLDENWAAMISDFGLSKIGQTNQSSSYVDASVKGTWGYLDPEYFYTGKLTRKTDVYAFGVVLFELISGRLPVDISYGEEQCSLVRWAQKCVKDRKLDQMVDSNIRGTIIPKCLKRFTKIADRCVLSVPKERPTMTDVVASLQALLELQGKNINSAQPSGIIGLTSKLHKYFGFSTRVNSDHVDPSKSNGENMNHCSWTVGDADGHQETTHQSTKILTEDLKLITYDELTCISRGFGYETCLSEWHYGKVYEGWFTYSHYEHIRLPVGIELFPCYHSRCLEKSELDLVSKKFAPPNFAKLIGYCLEDNVLFLVYERLFYINYEECLYDGTVGRLSLDTRVKMTLGIARALYFSNKTRNQTVSYQPWTDMMCGFERSDILLDKDFTAKISDYNPRKSKPSYVQKLDPHYSQLSQAPQPLYSLSNLAIFTVVLAEILTGEPITGINDLMKMNIEFGILQDWKKSLNSIANLCFEICNDVDSESKMVRVFKEYEKYIHYK